MKYAEYPGHNAIITKGWLAAHKWLLLRRISQLGILILFLLGPFAGIWIVKGNLTSSLTLDILPLTDPYVLLQSVFAGHTLESTALLGAVIVLVFYWLVGGRVYCSWVCPVNIITDTANSLRQRLDIKGSGARLSRQTRYWLLAMTFIMALLTGTMAWELINPVTLIHRGLVYGMGFIWLLVLAIFLFDLLVSRRGWCGHLCPMGAFYSLPALVSPLRISAVNRQQCDDCMDCFEILVIKPALKGENKGIGPVILSPNCTNCARCIDVCTKDVFHFSTRFQNKSTNGLNQMEIAS